MTGIKDLSNDEIREQIEIISKRKMTRRDPLEIERLSSLLIEMKRREERFNISREVLIEINRKQRRLTDVEGVKSRVERERPTFIENNIDLLNLIVMVKRFATPGWEQTFINSIYDQFINNLWLPNGAVFDKIIEIRGNHVDVKPTIEETIKEMKKRYSWGKKDGN